MDRILRPSLNELTVQPARGLRTPPKHRRFSRDPSRRAPIASSPKTRAAEARCRADAVRRVEKSDLALAYSNGFVTVEISHDALDRYVEEYGDVPLPLRTDSENGDRRVFDAKHNVRVIYDRDAQLREVNTRSREGLHVQHQLPPRRELAFRRGCRVTCPDYVPLTSALIVL